MNNDKTALKEGIKIFSKALNSNKDNKNLEQLKLERDDLRKKMLSDRKNMAKHNLLNTKRFLAPATVFILRALPYVLIPAILGTGCYFIKKSLDKPKEKFQMLTTDVKDDGTKEVFATFDHSYKGDAQIDDTLIYKSEWYKSSSENYERLVKNYIIPEMNVEEAKKTLQNIKGKDLDKLYEVESASIETKENTDESDNKEKYTIIVREMGSKSTLMSPASNYPTLGLYGTTIFGVTALGVIVIFIEGSKMGKYIPSLKDSTLDKQTHYNELQNLLPRYDDLKTEMKKDKEKYKSLKRQLKR